MLDKVLEFQKIKIKEILTKEDIAVDATCGNGFDTLFLANLAKQVYAFDIQEEALNSTKEKLKDFDNVFFFKTSHENIKEYVREEIKVCMFNLGFLPKGDKSITTKANSTVIALKQTLDLLKKEGIITMVCYEGHPEGKKESRAIQKFLKTLNQKEFQVLKYEFINQTNCPPYLLVVEKI